VTHTNVDYEITQKGSQICGQYFMLCNGQIKKNISVLFCIDLEFCDYHAVKQNQ